MCMQSSAVQHVRSGGVRIMLTGSSSQPAGLDFYFSSTGTKAGVVYTVWTSSQYLSGLGTTKFRNIDSDAHQSISSAQEPELTL